ncbi:basic leucine zipper 34 isoform X1 [Quercus robur]|uniref:basic leucine zipper 34 isoform X1 n=1 Tax=Quercus robur TaxID=38942 RepID=UPI002161F527|nr:basic leucine zipper 34 isoform X1 [Quercus robur]XP_050281320.1 basic leucine zipper 34 isoform X1 [Quercus robur]XP_050281321.1 basic leucine zipper 34 isoform X1 [Quercus robur]
MSRQAHLPPRCPIQKKPIAVPIHDAVSHPLHINESYPRHQKSSSQSSILDEQPAWLDDLLGDAVSNSKGMSHRRSVSDSFAPLDALEDMFPSLTPHKDDASIDVSETCSGLESACTYGPNSPRQKSNVTFTENAIVSALSEYVSQDPLPYIDGSLCNSAITHSHSKGDDCHSVGELNIENKAVKRLCTSGEQACQSKGAPFSWLSKRGDDCRSKEALRKQHSGQRSRVRKLQYIAELESTVDVLQTFESELSVRVASLLQQRVALSLENCTLKQQVARLQQEKLIMECEYQALKKELESLKSGFAKSKSSKVSTYFGSRTAAESSRSKATWQMLDMGKLNIS